MNERFLEKISIKSKDECWPWLGCKHRQGYGQFAIGRKPQLAHRLSFLYFNGFLPRDLKVCHSCDNPPCCNPNHLFLGTQKDNVQDWVDKGKHYQTKKTHCPRGHEYTDYNTYKAPGRGGKNRSCRTCLNDKKREARRIKDGKPADYIYPVGHKPGTNGSKRKLLKSDGLI